jgi:holo-[acyl-carrier protein] synthase
MSAAVVGVGTDIVSVERIARLLERGDTVTRWCTPNEIEYCRGRAHPARHFAARIAAKEAVVKALELTWDGPIGWRDIAIGRRTHGAPTVTLSGRVAAAAGDREIRLSLSHCDAYATAVAILLPPC